VGSPKGAPAAVKPGAPAYRLNAGQVVVFEVSIKMDGAQAVETWSGPLAYRVTSVEDGFTLGFRSALESKRRLKEGTDETTAITSIRRLGLFRIPSTEADSALKIDSTVSILRQSSEGAFPSYLGSVSRLMLESLPDKAATAWESSTEGSISVPSGPGKDDTVALLAREKTAYSLEEAGASPVIRKQYELATREQAGGEPKVKITGTGKTTFDTQAGLPREMSFDGTVAEANKNAVIKTLVTISGKLLEGKEREEALRIIASGRNVGDGIETPVRDPELITLLTQLKSGNKSQRKAAADKLASWPPNENRPQVARALVAALGDADLFARWSAVTALGVWYTNETVPDIIKRLEDPEHAVRWEAEKVLGQIADPRSCLPLALMVDKGTDRDFAANALEAMGPVAEEVAIKLLGSYAWEARNRAAKMLAKWGTKEAIPTLRLHLRDNNGIVAMASQDALRQINARYR
jgi:hypothetical protein